MYMCVCVCVHTYMHAFVCVFVSGNVSNYVHGNVE